MNYNPKPFSGLPDLRRMREIVMHSRAAGVPGCWHVGDVVWRHFLMTLRADVAQDVQVWEDAAGLAVGYALFDPYNLSCDWQVRPEARWRGLEEAMLAWVQARAEATLAGRP